MDLAGIRQYSPARLAAAEREAAVLAPIIQQGDHYEILFTKRSEQLGTHPGQMSFPGGGREPTDADLQVTALREANEEIGLSADETTLIGAVDDKLTVTNYLVRPFVGQIPDREYTRDEYEVAEIVRLGVEDLIDTTNYESEYREHPEYGPLRIHYFHVDGYTVWGATGEMLAQLLELTTKWEIPPEADRVADPDAELPI